MSQPPAETHLPMEPIELPEEVMAGLSRTQQRQMQQLRAAR